MVDDKKDLTQRYTLGEEIFNSVSHGVGVFFAVAGCAVLIVLSAIYADVWAVISSVIYGISMFALYLASTLYHSIQNKQHSCHTINFIFQWLCSFYPGIS